MDIKQYLHQEFGQLVREAILKKSEFDISVYFKILQLTNPLTYNILYDRYVKKMKVKEIARFRNLSSTSINQRIFRIKKRLLWELKRYEGIKNRGLPEEAS